jgi:hypothetical protein
MADENYKRKLTAILSADAVGYSRHNGQDEEATVRTIKTYDYCKMYEQFWVKG